MTLKNIMIIFTRINIEYGCTISDRNSHVGPITREESSSWSWNLIVGVAAEVDDN